MRKGFNGQSSFGTRIHGTDQVIGLRTCDLSGCNLPADYRAPKSRERLRDYYWFCLEHVREYNAAWNYYAGMSEAEIEADRRGDTYWHRPTWPFSGDGSHPKGLDDTFGIFDVDSEDPSDRAEFHPAATPDLAALAVMDLSPPVTREAIKRRYKELVKQHHPDANGGNRDAEEKLKAINQAYATLTQAAKF